MNLIATQRGYLLPEQFSANFITVEFKKLCSHLLKIFDEINFPDFKNFQEKIRELSQLKSGDMVSREIQISKKD